MSTRTLTMLFAAPCLTGVLAGMPAVAGAAVPFSACREEPAFSCASVAVPLDRSGRAPGTIALSVERQSAASGPSSSAVIALAGGPGQAALPFAASFAKAMAPALATRDLIVFDQRGTGTSDPLRCRSFSGLEALESISSQGLGALVERCALEIGPARGAFTTRESVQDIEALRHALGYSKLVLYGTSYGTKVAQEYAETYPERVESMVLDSVVPAGGPDPFQLPSFRAVRAVLAELCSQGACASIGSNPLGDLARLVARLRRHALGGWIYDGGGHRHRASLGELDLLGIVEAGDLNPALRALLPAAVRSALQHDTAPLLRLNELAEGLIPTLPATPTAAGEGAEEENNALFTATTCEETPFPWQRSASAATRHAEAIAALRAIPASAFYPFDPTSSLYVGGILACEDWPDASAPPPGPGPLPNVPALILSGAQDLRTPTSNATALAAQIADAQLAVVPYTGHAVLGSDFSGCAEHAVSAFFAGAPVQPCAASADLFAPTPLAPTRLAVLTSPPHLGGKRGRTLTAVLDTLVDLNRQVIGATLQAQQILPSGSSFGGLRAGSARVTSSAVILRGFSFVPGVRVSGTLHVNSRRLEPGTLRVSGSAAAGGTVAFGEAKRVTGTLGGRHFNVSLASVKLSRVQPGRGWPRDPLAWELPAPHGRLRLPH